MKNIQAILQRQFSLKLFHSPKIAIRFLIILITDEKFLMETSLTPQAKSDDPVNAHRTPCSF
jgi:hypothetical protein